MRKLFLVLLVLFCFCTTTAFGAQFPEKSLKVIVPFAPGGGLDVTVRMMTDLAPKYLNGQQLVVENMPGGGAVIGLTAAAKAKADGYTMVSYTQIAIASTIVKETPYKKDSFTPIAMYCFDPVLVVVKADSPIKDMQGFIDTAKNKPVSANTTGHVGISHLGGMILEKQLGLKLNYVHATGGGMQIPQLLGGHVDAGLVTLGEAAPYLRDGSLRCVGMLSDEDYPGFSSLERFSTAGVQLKGTKGVEWGSPRGLAVPAATPADIVADLDKAFHGLINDPEFIERMRKADFPLVYMNSKDFSAYMQTVSGVLEDMLKAGAGGQ